LRAKSAVASLSFAASLALGVALRLGGFDGVEAQYVSSFQALVNGAHLMPFFQAVTYLGDAYVWLLLAVLLLLAERRRPGRPLKLMAFLVVTTLATVTVKYALMRVRPFEAYPSLVTAFGQEDMPSYPSGHVARAAGGFTVLADGSRLLEAAFSVLIVLLALSRVALGAHYFTDTLGASLLSYPLVPIAGRISDRLGAALSSSKVDVSGWIHRLRPGRS
jgi:membrane-associated phospholipid phosphatase